MKDIFQSKCSLDTLKKRAFLMSIIREYFANEKVLEVETPILSSAGNTDVNIESFSSQTINSQSKSYLRTSPEFPLKRLLSQGIGDVFEMGKVFRQGEVSKTHNIEFSMLEWYRIDFDYNQLIQDVIGLFKSIFSAFSKKIPQVEIVSFQQCFKDYLVIDIQEINDKKLNSLCKKYHYSGSQLTKDEALDYLFATQIQPQLNPSKLSFVTLYPASQAALAQINPSDTNTSLRFEVFYQGHELGNGYQELTNPVELLERFKKDNIQRKNNNQATIKIDENLLKAMKTMPNCSGIAVGLDRLLMVLLNKNKISEVIAFSADSA